MLPYYTEIVNGQIIFDPIARIQRMRISLKSRDDFNRGRKSPTRSLDMPVFLSGKLERPLPPYRRESDSNEWNSVND